MNITDSQFLNFLNFFNIYLDIMADFKATSVCKYLTNMKYIIWHSHVKCQTIIEIMLITAIYWDLHILQFKRNERKHHHHHHHHHHYHHHHHHQHHHQVSIYIQSSARSWFAQIQLWGKLNLTYSPIYSVYQYKHIARGVWLHQMSKGQEGHIKDICPTIVTSWWRQSDII